MKIPFGVKWRLNWVFNKLTGKPVMMIKTKTILDEIKKSKGAFRQLWEDQ